MIYFTKKRDKDNVYDNTDIYFRTDEVCVEDIIADFCRFLLACGFQKGSIQDYINFEVSEEDNVVDND